MSTFADYAYMIDGQSYSIQDSICFRKVLLAIGSTPHKLHVTLPFSDLGLDHVRGEFATMDDGSVLFLKTVQDDRDMLCQCIQDCFFNIYRFAVTFYPCDSGMQASLYDLSIAPVQALGEAQLRKHMADALASLADGVAGLATGSPTPSVKLESTFGFTIDSYWLHLFAQENRNPSISLIKRNGQLFVTF